MAVIGMIAAATSAHAGGGGTLASGGGAGSGSSGACPDARFGARPLHVGDCGDDVKTLHWILKSDSYGVSLDKTYNGPTADSVRRFQRKRNLKSSGVVGRATRKRLIGTMARADATWYGLIGHRTACGVRLRPNTLGVAHRHLPCGTKVAFKYRGRFVRARVIDRGPYTPGVRWDLTKGTAKKLHFTSTGQIRAAPIK